MRIQLTRKLGQNKPGTILDRTHQEATVLINGGWAIHHEDNPPAAEADTVADELEVDDEPDDEPSDGLDDMTLADLKTIATQEGVATYGTKAEVAARIRTARDDHTE